MRDKRTHHFEPQRFDWVGSGGQGRSKYGAIWGNMGHYGGNFLPYFDLPTHPLPTRSNYYGKQVRFLGKKRALANPLELAQQHEQHENIVFLVSSHVGNGEIGGCAQ